MLCVQLMMILIKVSDISNEARPMEVAEPWLDCLLQEFYNQVITQSTERFKKLVNNFSFSLLRVMWRSWRVCPSPPSWTGIK